MTGSADVDAYLAALPDDFRRALHSLRRTIRAHLPPEAVECISYAMPGFRLGRMVAGYAGFTHHPGFYPHSGGVIPRLVIELAGWKTSKSGVLFTPETPLPASLVHRILDLRLAEIGPSPRRAS
jgi:uncharacterized protein YdhG (YjbR/CyaY superfamily)